jgi:hypothetical protein
MAFTLTIAGADVLDYLEPGPGLTYDRALQSRGIFRCTLKDYAGVYRPARRQDVIATIDGVRVFGGVVQRFRETDWGNYVGNLVTLEAATYEKICDTRMFNGVALGSTLRDLVDHLVTARLAGTGITRDPAMAAGPVLGPQGYSFKHLTPIFDELASIAGVVGGGNGWYWKINPFKVLGFYQIGTVAAPRNLTATNDTIRTISVTDDDSAYVNTVWLQYGEAGARDYTDVLHGDGSTHLFPLTNRVASPPPVVRLNGVTFPVAPWPGTGYQFYYRASDTAIIHDLGATTLVPADTLEIPYVAEFPGAVSAVDAAGEAAYGEYAIPEYDPSIYDWLAASRKAYAILRKRGGTPRTFAIATLTDAWAEGQTPTVDVSERAVNGPCLITGIKIAHEGRLADGGDQWRTDLELVEGTDYPESWLQYFRNQDAAGAGGVGSGSGSVGGVSGGAPSPAAPALLRAYLGGARGRAADRPAAQPDVWRAIPEWIDVEIDGDVIAAGELRVLCQTSDVACSVTPRLVSLTVAGVRDTVIATGTAIAALTWTAQTIPITFLGGRHAYRVEFTTSQPDVEVYVANAILQN